jgi:hypothetical protein
VKLVGPEPPHDPRAMWIAFILFLAMSAMVIMGWGWQQWIR